MPTPTKGGYLFYSPICEFPYRLIISRNGFTRFGKGVVNRYTPPLPRDSRCRVSRNVSPLPAVGITDVRYLTSEFPRVADLTSGKGRYLAFHEVPDITGGEGRVAT